MDGADPEDEVGAVSPDAAPALLRKQHSTNDVYRESSASGLVSGLCSKCAKTRLFCDCSTSCIVSCCQSCTFCSRKAVAKERYKSFIKNQRKNKICERCFYCRSPCFCPKCSQFPQCCTCSATGRSSPKLLADVVPPGRKSEGSVNFETRLHSPVQNKTPPLVRDPLIISGYANPLRNFYLKETLHALKASRKGKGSDLSSLLQQVVHCPQTKPEMAANLGPQCSKPIFKRKNIQNEDPRNNLSLLATRGMGDIAGFQRRLFPHTSTHPVPKVPLFSLPEPIISVSGPSLWPINSSYGVHLCGQRGQVNGSVPGYKDPPVPRRLVDSSLHQRILPPGHPVSPRPLPGVGLDSESPKITVGTQTGVQFCGLPV